MKVIAVHTHLNPRPFLDAVRAGRDWHGFNSKNGELENPKNHWTLEERIADMDRLGVGIQALTVYGDFNQYNRDPELSKLVEKACNDEDEEMLDGDSDSVCDI